MFKFFDRIADSKLFRFIFDSYLGLFLLFYTIVVFPSRWLGRDAFFDSLVPLFDVFSLDASASSLSQLSVFALFFVLGFFWILEAILEVLSLILSFCKKLRSRLE